MHCKDGKGYSIVPGSRPWTSIGSNLAAASLAIRAMQTAERLCVDVKRVSAGCLFAVRCRRSADTLCPDHKPPLGHPTAVHDENVGVHALPRGMDIASCSVRDMIGRLTSSAVAPWQHSSMAGTRTGRWLSMSAGLRLRINHPCRCMPCGLRHAQRVLPSPAHPCFLLHGLCQFPASARLIGPVLV